MKNKKRIEVLSQNLFDEKMKELGLDDDNVEDTNLAFVSIIGTPDCLKYYLDEENTKHYFKDHPNVINLDFDDITYDEIDWKGHKIKGLSMEQAQKLFEFIENNKDKDFYIHCRAGMSRSQGVGAFIYYFYPGEFESDTLQATPNKDVYAKLSRCYYKKYKPEYE